MDGLIGAEVDRVCFEIERGKIREFARATHAQDAAHLDPADGPVLATATHVVVAGHYRDQQAQLDFLGLDRTRVVVGSVEWTYARALRAGDTVTGVRRVIADEHRRGTMRLVTLETEFTDETGAVVVRQREVLIERSPA